MNATDKKARQCVVTPNGPDKYSVESPSGKTYQVVLVDQGAFARCTCPWGDIHNPAGTEGGCSHMRAVWLFEQGHPFILAEQAQLEMDQEYEEFIRGEEQAAEGFLRGAEHDAAEAYRDALEAGYSENDAAAAADSMIGYEEGE